MTNPTPNTLTDSITQILSEDHRVLFAYLYGSTAESGKGNDIDIAVFSTEGVDCHKLSADLKVSLHKKIGFPPDDFDVRILNGLLVQDDIFALLYLKNVLTRNKLLIDKNPDARTHFLEHYGTRFRECEGLIQEFLV